MLAKLLLLPSWLADFSTSSSSMHEKGSLS